ncbi:MAG: hypothetical protein M1818_007252 [Claussenomyces sp. TS43310]|nr:MAG: hypothetical protein M1818_007252 [Claussenomyces sp. TS43310]
MVELSADTLPKIKTGIHIAQAVFIFVAWCIMIAIFRSDAHIGGAAGFYFGLCFLSIPVIVYPTLTPVFPRSRKWANAYAFAILDILSTILWLAAFAALAAWNTADGCKSKHGCTLSKVDVGLGFFVSLFFALTSAISVYGVMYYRRNGNIPGMSRIPTNAALIDPDRDAFSTAPHDEYAPVHLNDKDDANDAEEGHAGQPLPYDTSYGGAGVYSSVPPRLDEPSFGNSVIYSPDSFGRTPSQSRPDMAHEQEPVQFPAGNYH